MDWGPGAVKREEEVFRGVEKTKQLARGDGARGEKGVKDSFKSASSVVSGQELSIDPETKEIKLSLSREAAKRTQLNSSDEEFMKDLRPGGSVTKGVAKKKHDSGIEISSDDEDDVSLSDLRRSKKNKTEGDLQIPGNATTRKSARRGGVNAKHRLSWRKTCSEET